MRPQEIFDTVATHLFTQGVQALDPEDCCVYRGPNGTKCAVGCLITDAEYNPTMEKKAIQDLIDNQHFPQFKPHSQLLVDLQEVHDSESSWVSTQEMRERLEVVALSYELDGAIVSTLSFKGR